MKAKTNFKGIKVKSTHLNPNYGLFYEAYVIGYNPFTESFIVCDAKGFIVSSLEIRNYDESVLSDEELNKAIQEIRNVAIRALSGVRNQLSTY
jgi:hypothetical protein